jgi:hypothetical protein
MEEPFRLPPNAPKVIDVGSIVVIHSLKSVRGAELNGKRAIVIDRDKDRWVTKVEGKENVATKTTSLKPDNLIISKKTVDTHPEYLTLVKWSHKVIPNLLPGLPWPDALRIYRNARGIAYDDTPPPERARKLTELLERPDGGYSPNQTVIAGEALMYYSVVPESSLNMDCTIYDLEHITGLISLTAMCQGEMMQAKGCGDGEPEAVLFALLEAAPMSITVLMEFLIRTPYIGPEEGHSKVRDAFRTAREACVLTPNQQNKDYCHAMRGGICLIFLLFDMNGPSKTVFIRVLIKHTLFPLFIQRLLRIVAREVMRTPDGLDLGSFARKILADIAYDGDDRQKSLLYSAICDGNVYLRSAIPAMLREEGVTSAEILRKRVEEWIDVPAAGRYCDGKMGIVR